MGPLRPLLVGTFRLTSGPHGFRLELEGTDEDVTLNERPYPWVAREAAGAPPRPETPPDPRPTETPPPGLCKAVGCGTVLRADGSCPRCEPRAE